MDNNKENIETAQSQERKSPLDWNKWDAIFFVLPIILTILVPLGGLPYLCGRLSRHLLLDICIFYPASGIFIIFCFFASIVRLISGLRRYTWKKKSLIITEIGIPVLFVALFIIFFFIPIESDLPHPGKAFTYGLRDRVRSKADIPAIRDWLRTLSKEDYAKQAVSLPSSEWPKSLKALKPGAVLVSADKNDNPQIRISWGGGLFHWGVAIGMEDMVIPPSDLSRFAECWLLVEPGVYVYDW